MTSEIYHFCFRHLELTKSDNLIIEIASSRLHSALYCEKRIRNLARSSHFPGLKASKNFCSLANHCILAANFSCASSFQKTGKKLPPGGFFWEHLQDMSQSSDHSSKDRIGRLKRKERNLSHFDKNEFDTASLPMLQKKRCHCEWLFVEVPTTAHAEIAGDNINPSNRRGWQAEKDTNVELWCSPAEQNSTQSSIRSCVQTCKEEISRYREHIMAWMRKEMHNFVYGESPVSGCQLNLSGRAGGKAGNGGHEYDAESFEARIMGNDRFAEQSSECKSINPDRRIYSAKPEGAMIAGDEIHDIGVLFRGQASEGQSSGLTFGVQTGVHGGLKLGVQSIGQIEGMQKFLSRHPPAYGLGNPDCSSGVLGFGLTGQADGSGVNLADSDRSDFQGACSFITDISRSANTLDLGRPSGLSYGQSNLVQAGLQEPSSSVQDPSTLGMVWNMMHNMVLAPTRASSNELINYSSEVANKTSNGAYIAMHSSYDRNLEIINSSIVNSSNGGERMQLPPDLHAADTSGGMQALIGLPSAAEVQIPVGTQDFLNLGMSEYAMRAALSDQLLSSSVYCESTSHEKFATGHDILASNFAARKVNAFI